jgi:hypothetical protein
MWQLREFLGAKRVFSACLFALLLTMTVAGGAGAAGISPSSASSHPWAGFQGGRAALVQPFTGNEGVRDSLNWAGYEAVDWYSYKEINGHWSVRSVSGVGDAAQWVGFNGDPNWVPSDWSGPLAQIGTDSIATSNQDLSCLGQNVPHYFAWVEAIGHSQNGIPQDLIGGCGEYLFAVNPGDQITASISISGNYAYLAINDTTNGQDRVITFNNGQNLSEYTAEWIVERSGVNCPLRLANFGTASFTNALLKAGNNVWYPITYNSYVADNITNYGLSSGALLAKTSGLSSGNTAFSVQYIFSGSDKDPECNL